MSDRTNEAKWIESRGHWRIDVQKDRVRKSFYSSTPGRKGKIECHKKADKWLSDGLSNTTVRVGDLMQMWIEHQKILTSKSAWRQYETYVRLYFEPLRIMKIEKLTEQDFQEVLDELAARGMARKTISNVRGAASSFCKWCRKHNYTQLRVDDLTIAPIAKKAEKHVLSVDDYQKVMSTTETTYRGKTCTDWYIHAYRFALVTGLRPGELIGLRWASVDRSAQVIRISEAINWYGEHTRGKNENARRIVPIGQVAVDILKSQYEMLKEHHILSEYVFPNKNGLHTSQEALLNAWHRFQEHNGMKRLTMYELRHTFVSSQKGLPEGMLRDVVGHSRDMDTFGTYGHLFGNSQSEAAQHIDENVNKILKFKK